MQYRKRTVLREADKKSNVVQTIPFVDASRDDDTRSRPDTAVHVSGLYLNRSRIFELKLSSPLVPAFRTRHRNTREKYETYGQRKQSEIRFRRKVKNSSVTLRGRIACFTQLKPSLVVAGQSAVQQPPCERQLVLLKMFRRCRLPRHLVETEYTPAPGLCS